jgi:hypothetical protein
MMLQAQQPGSKALMVRHALSCSLTLALAFSVACMKKDPPPTQTASANTSRNAPVDTSYLPQNVFGPGAVPGVTVLQPVDLHSLSDTELKYGIAPKRTSQVEYQPDGIGAFGFNTGVFIGMRFDGTLLRAPDISFLRRQATIDLYLDSGVGYSLPGFVVKVINDLLSLFTKYQIDRVGTILKGPSDRLFHGETQIPAACATPKAGGS